MALYDTLQYVDGGGATQEVALSLPNLSGNGGAVRMIMEPRSHAVSTMILSWAQPPESGIAIPFKSRCVVYAGRTSVSGAPNTFSGGTILFQGRRTNNPASASADRVNCDVIISDAWWDLTKITYQAAANVITGGTIGSPTFTPFLWPDVVLFQATPGVTYVPAAVNSTITTWQQIQGIINFATGFYAGADAVQLQIGASAEFTPVYTNWYPMRSGKCHEGLNVCLRPHPAVFTEIDYTTTPPTIHFRNRANMTAVNLPYASTLSGIVHLATDIQSLDELVPDAVRLYYKVTGTFNGQPIVSFQTDFYPLAAPNSLLCLDYSIDVTGAALSQTVCTLASAAFDPTTLPLWQKKVSTLKSVSAGGQIPNTGSSGALLMTSAGAYDAVTNPKGIQVIGDDGIDYSATYGAVLPYYTDGDVYTWMQPSGGGAKTVVCTVKAFFSYTKVTTAGAGIITDMVAEHQHSMRVVLTNLPSSEYILNQTLNSGEGIPTGLAQAIYTELQTKQWKLRHEIIQVGATAAAIPTLIKPGKHCINLTGPGVPASWTTMNAVPETVNIEFFRTADGKMVAKHSISCGPVNHLEPGYIVQLANLFVNRNRSGIDAHQRLTGTMSSNQSDLSATGSKENSVPGQAVPQMVSLAFVSGGVLSGLVVHNSQNVSIGESLG